MKSYLLLSLIISTTYAFSNSIPVLGRRPGYQYGTGASGIDIEIVYDLLCSDSANTNPVV